MNQYSIANSNNEPTDWDKDIAELKQYFESILLPTQTIKLNQYTTIMDISLFLEGHFAVLKTYNGERIRLPYLHRLQELKHHLISLDNIYHIRDG